MRLFKKKSTETDESNNIAASDPAQVQSDLPNPRKPASKNKLLIVLLAIIIIAGLVLGGVLYRGRHNDKTEETQPDPKAVVNQLNADYEARQKAREAAPQTAKEQLVVLQKTLTDQHVDMSQPVDTIVKNIKENVVASEAMVQAALVAAQAKDDIAKKYAAIGIQLFSKDDYSQKVNAGLIARLTAISKGDYSVVQ